MKRILSAVVSLLPFVCWSEEESSQLSYQKLLPDFNKMTPELESLGSFGDYGISEYTGSPEINIPLLSVGSRDISVPINLSYDASGIRVDQDATFVGLGWNLSYGGCITHIVCGKDDFNPGYRDYRDDTLYTFIDSLAFNRQEFPYSGNVHLEECGSEVFRIFNNLSKGYSTPDYYQANFCGHSVCFLIDPIANKPVIIGDNSSKYDIEYVQGLNKEPYSFKIVDDQGVSYMFSAYTERANKYDVYYLEEIQGLYGDSVAFTYRQIGTSYQLHRASFFQSKGKQYENSIILDRIQSEFLDIRSSVGNEYFSQRTYIDKITTAKEIVSFSYEARDDIRGEERLKSITVNSKNGNVETHSIRFEYGYFKEDKMGEGTVSEAQYGTTNQASYIPKRLKLTKLQVDSQKYEFEYHNEDQFLPYKTSLSQDYWGYYNGVNNGRDFVSSPLYKMTGNKLVQCVKIGEANRYSSEQKCQIGVLEKIKFPTGGYSKFEYEPHYFSDPDGYLYYEADAAESCFKESITLGAVAVESHENVTNKSISFEITEDVPDALFEIGCQSSDNGVTNASVKIEGNGFILNLYTDSRQTHLSRNVYQDLRPGTYHVEVNVNKNSKPGSAIASVRVSCKKLRQYPINLNIESNSQKGGESMGAGLRIRNIKKYDSDNKYLGETRYEYQGGKLLIPTTRAELLEVMVFSHPTTILGTGEGYPIWCRFYFCGSSSSYSPYCSIGRPTIGYSFVKKTIVNADNEEEKRMEMKFINEGYTIFNKDIFYYLNYDKNGKMKEQTVYIDQTHKSITNYYYETKLLEKSYFLTATPLFVEDPQLYYSTVLFGKSPFGFDYKFNMFPKFNYWTTLFKTVETQYINDEALPSVITIYGYNDFNYKTSSVCTFQNNLSKTTISYYPNDSISVGSADLTSRHCLSRLTGEESFINDQYIGGAKIDFKMHRGYPVAEKQISFTSTKVPIEEMEVTDYDDYGNIREYKTKDGIYTTIIWSYNHLYPVLQVVGTQYKDIKGYVTSLESAKTLSKTTLVTAHSNISGVGGIVTAYLYDAWYGVSDIIAPNKKITHYDRDSQGRLSAIRENDSNGPVIQSFFYKYLTQ